MSIHTKAFTTPEGIRLKPTSGSSCRGCALWAHAVGPELSRYCVSAECSKGHIWVIDPDSLPKPEVDPNPL